ncbi:sulfotransferase family protein [Sphingomonas sp. URHD0057]|uniref:sulfotransferase family protein n=1 Tax=Sphingomonas sp. URHD0057 TaxID=1380389 RepID=UPI00048F5FB2|nr:sulfotransferase [Sphingomonas sp. URHD0057]
MNMAVHDLKLPMASSAGFERFLFIAGAPRCGTTTLSRFLKDHPAVRFPALKEPHFFTQHDLRRLPDRELERRVERDYLRRFFSADGHRSIGVDGSVSYLYSPERLEPILRLWPDSRFVVSVRDPLTMLPSLHRRLIYVGQETIPDFANAWAAVADRAEGRKVPRACQDARLLRYDEAARFGTYVERLFKAVGRERCLVLVFDDLAANPAEQYGRLMDFAGLEPQPAVDFSPSREGQSVKFRWLQRVLKQPPGPIKERLGSEFFRKHHSRDGAGNGAFEMLMAVRRRLLRWNRTSAPIYPMPMALQREIAGHFTGEVERLGALVGRDLSHWLQPSRDLGAKLANGGPASARAEPYRRAYSQ